jgi:aminomethyltransferase
MAQQTPFRKFHEDQGAKFVEFAGWEMPLHYGSVVAEHEQTRRAGSLFDVSHMGRLYLSGRHARKLLETVLTRRITDMEPMRARYSLMCNDAGGVIDDVLVYRLADKWLLVVNASNRQKVVDHLKAVAEQHALVLKLDDQTLKTAMVALQGPSVMDQVGKFSREVPGLPRYGACEKNLMILKMLISRTGYTGEDGIEVILGAGMASMAIKLLLKEKGTDESIKPAGLGARDTLRIEAGMPLYGHELDEQTNPIEAGLKWAVDLKKGSDDVEGEPPVPRFIGQDALEQVASAGPARRLIGLKLDGKRTPRQGAAVSGGGEAVGVVTSGCLSPTLGVPIAMAYVQPAAAGASTLQVQVGGEAGEAQVVTLPFYKRG